MPPLAYSIHVYLFEYCDHAMSEICTCVVSGDLIHHPVLIIKHVIIIPAQRQPIRGKVPRKVSFRNFVFRGQARLQKLTTGRPELINS